MFFRARRAVSRAWFDFNCRALLETPPVVCASDAGFTLVSQTCHGELRMNLLAVKSFVHRLGRQPRIVVINDGSLTPEDKAVIAAHLQGSTMVHIAEIPKAKVPRGGSWESLMLVCDVAQSSYVVQIDSDTVCLSDIDEVRACIDARRCFTLLGDHSFPEVESMHSACARAQAKGTDNQNVQAVCERGFDQLPESAELKYVRGNAGFIGFAQGSITRERIEWFSDRMRQITQGKWDEWGSEQVATNLLVANSADGYPLQSPKYLTYWAHPDLPYRESAFLHFVGPHRFSNGFYIECAKRAIADLMHAETRPLAQQAAISA